MRTYASHGTGKGRSDVLPRGDQAKAPSPPRRAGHDQEPDHLTAAHGWSRPSGHTCARRWSFDLSLLLAAACALLLLACLGEGAGGNHDVNDNGNNGTTDASVDSEVPPDAWTFDCPASQPEGHICFRGRVRRLVDDSPVAIPGGSRIQRIVPAPGEDRPTLFQSEAHVQEDGRFIFPSVEVNLRLDAEDLCGNDPDCWPYKYDYFDLVMEGDEVIMVDDSTGLFNPRNRYGVAQRSTVDPANYVFAFYLLGRDTYDAWQDRWPGYRDPWIQFPSDWCGLEPFTFDEVQVIVPVCFSYASEPPSEIPTELFPGGWNLNVWPRAEPLAFSHWCAAILDEDRLDYPDLGNSPYPESSEVGLILFDPQVNPEAKVGFICDDFFYEIDLWQWPLPAYGTVSARDGSADGHILILHGLAHYM